MPHPSLCCIPYLTAWLVVSEVGLRGLEGLFLVSVCRAGKLIHAVGPDLTLKEGECLLSRNGCKKCLSGQGMSDHGLREDLV